MTDQINTQAESNWNQIRAFLCARIGRQRTALACLAADGHATDLALDPESVGSATDLIALLTSSEQKLDRAFAQLSVRATESSTRSEARATNTREFQSR